MNPYFKRTEIRARREPFMMNQVDIMVQLIEQRQEGRYLACANPLTFTEVPQNQPIRLEPTFSLEPEAAQQLMDELWRAGLRPTEGSGSAGQLASTLKHLEDMRSLVFKKEPKP